MVDTLSVNTQEVVKALDKFSDDVRIGITKKASRRSAKIVKDVMADLVAKRSGAIQSSIAAKTKVDTAGGRAFSIIGALKKVSDPNMGGKKVSQRYKANFLEHGTKYMKADPFIEKSLEKTQAWVELEYNSVVDKELKNL
jgi:HK97 gp10 family phage protein